ncbi:MAG TPA: DUF4251 domain-containing protein [Hanamia sp.]|jgi:hypothetical protein|nr:DUF4251 domain-containing protein [Hanamia sp.]
MKIKYIEKFVSCSFLALFISMLLLSCSSSKKAVKLNSDEVRNAVDSSRFVFVAERVTPLRGATRYLTSRYDVVVKKDTVNCYLPFFGRAFQAPIDPSKGGIQFRSTSFSYSITPKNNNQWEVSVKPNNNSDVQELFFNIFDNGSATLNVVNTHRDPISFSGHIERINE